MKILSIFAHIEDHICFGWPLMQNKDIENHLIVCTNDGNGVLQKSCNAANIHLAGTLECPDGFYYNRVGELDMVAQYITEELERIVKNIKPDFIFTHNPWGEYGHFDHKMVFEIAYGNDIPLIISDIQVNSVCFPTPKRKMYDHFYTLPFMSVSADYGFYTGQVEMFREVDMWTHNCYLSKPYYPPTTVQLYKVEN